MTPEKLGVKVKMAFTLRKFDDATKTLLEEITGGDDKPLVVTKYDPQGNVVGQETRPVTFLDELSIGEQVKIVRSEEKKS